MQFLDVQVVENALSWLEADEPIWLCTVLSTYGSSPRPPGALLATKSDGRWVGSLSGGCIEEDFIERLKTGEFDQSAQVVRYGEASSFSVTTTSSVSLPCGGILEVLVEKLAANELNRAHLNDLLSALNGQSPLIRKVDIRSGAKTLIEDASITGPKVTYQDAVAEIRVGPAAKLIIAGMSPVSAACASFAATLGFEVIICDPNEGVFDGFNVQGVTTKSLFPSRVIATKGMCHSMTAVVALTHDPRIDDLAMMDAVKTPAFYIGVMGSHRTSNARAARLKSSGGLTDQQIERIIMPIGLALGSKTPAEIALAVMSDVVRTLRGKSRDKL
ncbi:MAG: XdhC family protein [Oleibacter sp.]|nr:XdhC family protein [Thalassolituus sp.]